MILSVHVCTTSIRVMRAKVHRACMWTLQFSWMAIRRAPGRTFNRICRSSWLPSFIAEIITLAIRRCTSTSQPAQYLLFKVDVIWLVIVVIFDHWTCNYFQIWMNAHRPNWTTVTRVPTARTVGELSIANARPDWEIHGRIKCNELVASAFHARTPIAIIAELANTTRRARNWCACAWTASTAANAKSTATFWRCR